MKSYELKGSKDHFFIRVNMEKDRLERVLVRYKKETRKITQTGFISLLKKRYKVEKIKKTKDVEATFEFDPISLKIGCRVIVIDNFHPHFQKEGKVIKKPPFSRYPYQKGSKAVLLDDEQEVYPFLPSQLSVV